MDLGDGTAADTWLENNAPVKEFLNLSSNEIHYLIYEPYGERSPMQFRNDIDNQTLDQIPLFRIAEEYLKIIERDKLIRLTPLGAIPKKVLKELYDKKILADEFIESGLQKLNREYDCLSIMSTRIALEKGGFVKKIHGKLYLTKKGMNLLQSENRLQLFKSFFQAFTDKFDWWSNDQYENRAVGQLGWAFSIFMLNMFGHKAQTIELFALKYLRAFPKLIAFFDDHFSTPEQQFIYCYGVRTFTRFFLWFGFVKVEKQHAYLDLHTDKFINTELVNRVFLFDLI